jgi:dipeptidyl aminopeptidase/acylaminoacyl peptidase
MQGEKFVGYSPEDIRWDANSSTIYFSWNPEQDSLRATYRVGRDGGTPERLTPQAAGRIVGGGRYNADRSERLFTRQGDIYIETLGAAPEVFAVTNTLDRESNPQWLLGEAAIVFERADNLYSWNRITGQLAQLTNFREGDPPQEKEQPAYRQWLKEEQQDLFAVLRDRKTQRELRRADREAAEVPRPSPVYYGKDRLSDLRVSPDGRFVTYVRITQPKEQRTQVPAFVTESGYLDIDEARVKVGSPQNQYRLGVYDTERDTNYFVDPGQLPGIYDKPAFLAEYHRGDDPYEDQYEDPRAVILHGPFYSDDGRRAALVIRSLDNKDRWICSYDPASNQLTTLDRQHDDAWIGGPGIEGWNFTAGTIGWLPDNETLYFQSEATGYSHLYTHNVRTGDRRQLTQGAFEVHDITLSADGRTFYLSASAEGPFERHFYHLPIGGGELQRITTLSGHHAVTLSPDQRYLAIRYSYSNQPWELYVQENRPGSEPRRLTESTTPAFQAYPWREPQLVRFTARDGAQVPARLYRPRRARRNGPAVIFVHGAGYLQNVHRWWSSYYREYMFHNLLVDRGYTVLDIDYRASAGYGRDWRTAIYRHMGGWDLNDQLDGAKYLVDELGIDRDRIGIYGGSYGGFITLMALFTSPGTFQSGAALRSVTDWAHYNHAYTSNILNTPVEDSLAYAKSSPIYHADGLADRLLILHGMVDDNVQFQDVVRLAQRLIELEKENWEFAVFPVEAHGFVEPSSWADEYRRILELFEATLR